MIGTLKAFSGLCACCQVEGPAVFKPTSKDYFLMASSMTYWDPNPPLMFHASAAALHGAHWHSLPTPAQGPGANITYNSQSSFIFPLDLADGTRLFIYMGDRWNFASPGSVRCSSAKDRSMLILCANKCQKCFCCTRTLKYRYLL